MRVEIEWIPVTERLPDGDRMVIYTIIVRGEAKTVRDHTNSVSVMAGGAVTWHGLPVTAWAELPAPYNPDTNNAKEPNHG